MISNCSLTIVYAAAASISRPLERRSIDGRLVHAVKPGFYGVNSIFVEHFITSSAPVDRESLSLDPPLVFLIGGVVNGARPSGLTLPFRAIFRPTFMIRSGEWELNFALGFLCSPLRTQDRGTLL